MSQSCTFLIRGKDVPYQRLIRGSNKLSEAYQKLIRAKMFLIRILIRGLSEDGITKKPLEVEHPAQIPKKILAQLGFIADLKKLVSDLRKP